jgi:ADP-ribose pyrophosphatase
MGYRKDESVLCCHRYFTKWIKQSSVVYSTSWFNIKSNKDFHVLEYLNPQVVVLPKLEKNLIILVKVKRPVIGTSTWELPAGGLESGETVQEGALRELKEETGVSIKSKKRLQPMNSLVVSPTRMPMFPNLFSINITKEEFELRESHDDEIEEVGLFSFDEIRQMILNEKIFVS